MYIWIYTYIYIHAYIHTHIHVCIYAYICVYTHVCAHTYVYIYTHTCVYVFRYTCISMCRHRYMCLVLPYLLYPYGYGMDMDMDICLGIHHILLYPFISEHLGCFHVLAMNMGISDVFSIKCFPSFRYVARSRCWSNVSSVLRRLYIVFHSGCINWQSPSTVTKVYFLHILTVLLHFSILTTNY